MLIAFVLALPGFGQAPVADVADDPLPIRRVQVPASRLSAEMDRARAGVLVPLSRAEFEKRVRLAAKDRQEQPRLLKASYRATVGEGALINGRGEWTVQYQGAAPAILPLPDFNLALNQLRDANNKDAVLCDVGKALGLLIDKAGNDNAGSQKFYFDWTLRGIPGAAGQAFAMHVPNCAAAILELRLPADQLLVVSPKTAMLSGPHESESPSHRLWRMHFTGRSQIDFAVKKQSGPQGKPVVLTSVQCRQLLLPGRCQADFDYQLEVLHGHVDQFTFACDPDLEPYEVTFKNVELKGWEIREPAKGKRLLIVSLREPLQGTLAGLVIRCFAPLKADQRWISPGLQMQHALTRGEIIQLNLHPDVQLQGWQPGQFQLLRSSVNPGGTQTLMLGRSGEDEKDQADRITRPSGKARYGGVEFLSKQKSWWHIGPRAATLTTEIAYEIHRGSLFQLALTLPRPHADWTVETVQLNPGKKAPTWMLAGNSLLINLDAPLTAAGDARLRVRLRSEHHGPWPTASVTLPFPDLVPVEPCLHAGELGVSVDPSLEARVLGTSLASGPVDVHGPWGKNILDYHFSYRQQAAAGNLQVQARRPRLDAQVATEVVLSGPQAAWHTRLMLGPLTGSPAGIDLAVSGAGLRRLRMQSGSNTVRGLTRQPIAEALTELLALGCRGSFEQALLALSVPRGQRWRIELAEPLEQRVEINLEAPLEPAGADKDSQTWEVPLVTVLDAERHEMQIAIQTLNTATTQYTSAGLKFDGSLPAGNRSGHAIQSDGTPFPRLTLQTRPQTGTVPGAAESCERLLLLSEWLADGAIVHHFRFDLLNWSKPSMPVMLPAGTRQVLGVRADGRWLDAFPRQATPEGMRVELPVPADGFRHTFDIVYLGPDTRSDWSIGDWLVCGALPSPLPKLPIPAPAPQRRWRLPADLVPLHGAAFRTVASFQDDGPPGLAQVRGLWHLGDSLFTSLRTNPGVDDAAISQQLLAADLVLRKKNTKPRQLGDVLQDLAQQLGVKNTLVLDASALEAAGLRAQSPIAPPTKSTASGPLWEQAGLLIIPCRPALLVTTRGWLDAQADRDAPLRLIASLSRPLQEANLHGQDRSGRFRALASWLRRQLQATDESAGLDQRAYSPGQLPGWTEWELAVGHPLAEELAVIRRPFLTASGIVLALAIFATAWSVRNRVTGGWRFRLWLAWLSGALLGCIWLPSPYVILASWILLSALLIALVGWLGKLPRGRPSSAGRAVRGGATVAVLLGAVCWLAMHGAARSGRDEPFTVLLLPGKNGAHGQDVLAPQELLQRLDRLAEGVQPLRDAVVLTGARYRGAVHGSTGDFKVDFSCFSFADKGQLFVPLDGVDLQPGAFLDGAPAFPVVAPVPRNGYLVPVHGKGPHQLSLAFSARVTQTGVNQQLRFQIPRLAQNQLVELLMPASAQWAQAFGALGSQTLAKSGNDGSLRAQLGPQQVMDVRWRSAAGQPGPVAQMELRELYYWDLRLPLPKLTGVLKYSIAKGQVSVLTLSMPDELELQGVEVTAGPMSQSTPRLKSWTVRGGKDKRTLTMELLTPVSGDVQVKLTLAPRLAVRPGNVSLPLPFPLQIKPAGFQEGFLAYRVAGLEARESPKDLGIIGIEPAAFVKEWRQTDASGDVQPTRAVNFRRNSPKANLGLSLLSPSPIASQEITWDVQPFHADLTAVCELNATAGDLMLLEWHVPAAVVLADVYGPHVHGWSRQDSLVQVWLTQPQKETRVTLWGWLRHAAPLLPGKVGIMALPHVSLRQPAPTATVVHLQPERGLKLETVRIDGLRPLRSHDSTSSLLYAPIGPAGGNYAANVRLAQAPVTPTYRSLTVLQARDEQLTLTAELSVQAAGTASLQVQARGWPANVQLDVPDSLSPPQRQLTEAGVSWTVPLRPGLPERIPLRLHAETGVSRSDELTMPDVRIAGASAVERLLGILGPELTGAAGAGVTPAPEIGASLASWPERVKQFHGDSSLWKVLADDWRLTVKARTAFAAPAVQVVSCEHESALAPDGRWVHEARFDLFTRGGGEVRVRLPGTSGLTALHLDGFPTQPTRDGKHWRVALPRATGPHVLRVRWQHAAGAEAIDAPNLATPALAGIGAVKVAGITWLPAELRESSLTQGQRVSAAQWMLAYGQNQVQLCTLLVQHRKDMDAVAWEHAMRRAQERFYWSCHQAEHLASRAADTNSGNDRGVAETVKHLLKENAKIAEKHQYSKLQKSIAKAASLREPVSLGTSSLNVHGIAIYWRGEASTAPVLRLIADAAKINRDRLLVTQSVIMAFVGLLILSLLPGVARLGRALWPEQILLLAAAAWLAFGPSLPGVMLITLAVAGRLLMLVIWVRRWLGRRTDPASGSSLHPTGA